MSFKSPPAWSMGGTKRSLELRSDAPGPGSYNPTLTNKYASPRWRLGTSTRNNTINSSSPGPGAYNSPGRISRSPPNYSMGSRFSSRDGISTPGPGAYSPRGLRSTEHRSPSYSMRPKTSIPSDNQRFPGPGSYDQTSRILNESIRNVKMGTSQRDDFYKRENNPGPGTYTARPNSASGPRWGFGTSPRGMENMSKTLPGPGSYNLKSMFEGSNGSNFRGTSLTPRRPDSALTNASRTPGPGAYNPIVQDRIRSPSYRMGSASRDGLSRGNKDTPGPGNYQPRYPGEGPSIGFGTSSRRHLGNSSTPGPGSYNPPSKMVEGPQYGFSPRREGGVGSSRGYTPGPGAYSPRIDFTRTKSPGTRMGTESRDGFSKQKVTVGPGSYNLRRGFGGPKWGFGSEPRGGNYRKDGPGPGHYNIKSTIGDVPSYVYQGLPLKIHL